MRAPFARNALSLRGGLRPFREGMRESALKSSARHGKGGWAGGGHGPGALAAAVLAEVADVGVGVGGSGAEGGTFLRGLGRQGRDLVDHVLHLVRERGGGRVGRRRRLHARLHAGQAATMAVGFTVASRVARLVEASADAQFALVARGHHAHGPAHLAGAAAALVADERHLGREGQATLLAHEARLGVDGAAVRGRLLRGGDAHRADAGAGLVQDDLQHGRLQPQQRHQRALDACNTKTRRARQARWGPRCRWRAAVGATCRWNARPPPS